MDFGTGVVKITPAHDPNDFEVGLRHNLPVINVMNEDGTHQRERRQVRRAWTAMRLPQGDCGGPGGGRLSRQGGSPSSTTWATATAAAPSLSRGSPSSGLSRWSRWPSRPSRRCARGETQFVPERFEKIYFNWMENIRDWCISRQLWWGHRIPAWYCQDCGEMIVVAGTIPPVCPKCGGTHLRAGRGHPGHLVLLRPVALLHPGLAGQDAGAGLFLSHQHPGHRL